MMINLILFGLMINFCTFLLFLFVFSLFKSDITLLADKPTPSVSLGAEREGRRNIGVKTMFKYFVFDLSSCRYLPVSGVHGADFAKQFAPCDIWIKIPFFNYFAPSFCGYNIELLKQRRENYLIKLGVC